MKTANQALRGSLQQQDFSTINNGTQIVNIANTINILTNSQNEMNINQFD